MNANLVKKWEYQLSRGNWPKEIPSPKVWASDNLGGVLHAGSAITGALHAVRACLRISASKEYKSRKRSKGSQK